MNVLKEGIIQIHKEFFELKEGWDGYNAKPVDADVLESIRGHGVCLRHTKYIPEVRV
jgi:hypothetical protein